MTGDDEVILLLTRAPLVLPLFALVLVRVTGLLLTAPILGSEVVPVRIRAGFAAVVAILVFPLVAPTLPAEVSLGAVLAGLPGELLIGLTMGLALGLVFVGVQIAGMVVGQQAGMALGEVYNPVMDSDSSVLGQTFFLTALAIFVLVGGHRELMRALLDTYATIPVLSYRIQPATLELVTDVLTGAYALGLRMAAPVLMSLLIATLVTGFLSRTMPQLNILSIGFPIRALISLGLCGFVLAASGPAVVDALSDVFARLREAFNG